MNAIVVMALRQKLTFVVLAILILVFGGLATLRTPTDIFPNIGIPVVAVVWTYNGLSPEDMSGRVVYYFERTLTTDVGGIEHIESQSLYGRAIVKIFFQPGTDIAAAQSQITATSQTVLKQMPAGMTPPQVLVYNASSVPVLDLQVAAKNMPVTDIYNLASNFIRPQLVTVPGVAIPTPYGGMSKYVDVDLDQEKLIEHGLSASDVQAALARQNIVLPAGDQKIGKLDYFVTTNATPIDVDTFNDMPVKQVGNAIVTLGDVAYVHSGGPPQTNIVLVRGQQAVLIEILKAGDASTLAVVDGVKRLLPEIERTLPPGVTIKPLNDASTFVRDSIADVVREMGITALLTGILVLVFLGSWQATAIVVASIPLSILASIVALSWLHQSINVMTLGGLALAVGILVDNATVMVENIASHLETGQELEEAIIDAANQIIIPTLVATLCICVVFLPLFSLSGVAGYLFAPLAMAIVFAMLASFILSRTLVPTMAAWMLKTHVHGHDRPVSGNPFSRFQRAFETGFTGFRNGYRDLLALAVLYRVRFIVGFLALTFVSMALVPFLGRNFFPGINSDEIDMHMRAQIGTRIEDSAKLAALVNAEIRHLLPGEVQGVTDNCGLPVSGINEAYGASGTIGPSDCDLVISLTRADSPVDQDRAILRRHLPALFPGTSFAFLPGDITAKILDFGLPSPIDVQVIGRDTGANYEYAKRLLHRLRRIPGLVDARIQQGFGAPTLRIATSRAFALTTGLTEADVAHNALASLSGSGQTAPSFWLNVKNGVSHLVNVQTPQNQLQTMNDLETIPIDRGDNDPGGEDMQILGATSSISQLGSPLVVSHRSIIPVIDIYASNAGRDLGAVSAAVARAIDATSKDLPHDARLQVQGQASTMTGAYSQLYFGLALSVALVYLILVATFQSWLDPFIIITALPAALAGIVWMLFVTGTTLSVPALTGAILCMGVATANSILVVSFARSALAEHGDAARAAVEAGFSRVRPVLMTALAMIVGMVPMSLSNTQNAPLGRAVMGGLIVATIATLLFVPAVFALLHARPSREPVASREKLA